MVGDGSVGLSSALNGCSTIEAGKYDEALKLVDGHPFLSDKTGEFGVEVFELMPVPM